MVGKYVKLTDSYKSLNEALTHGGIANDCKVNIRYVDSEDLEKDVSRHLTDVDGILVPGGFGSRGIEGKINAVTYARENKIPYFGICLGMQLAVIETARNLGKLKGAHSTEFDEDTDCPIIYLMEEWVDRDERVSEKGSIDRQRRHHAPRRVPVQAEGRKPRPSGVRPGPDPGATPPSLRIQHAVQGLVEGCGMEITGISPDETLVEIVELKDHPWFLGCQFHPEFKSKPFNPHPLFREFIKASLKYRQDKGRWRKK